MSYNFSKLRVLIVDDSPNMRGIIKTVLVGIGIHNIVEAGDGAQAIEALSRNAIDLAIIDWSMPVYDGIEFVKHIRTDPMSPNPYLPVIMVTGHTERRLILQARDAGVTEFLAKPITANGLISRLIEIVERPRPFIKTKTYFGPCRRRHKLDEWSGIERRGGTPKAGRRKPDEAEENAEAKAEPRPSRRAAGGRSA